MYLEAKIAPASKNLGTIGLEYRAGVLKLYHVKDPPAITSPSRGPPANQELSLPAKIPIT